MGADVTEKMPTDKLVDISPMALRMSSPSIQATGSRRLDGAGLQPFSSKPALVAGLLLGQCSPG